MKANGLKGKTFKCTICGKGRFTSPVKVAVHQRAVHGRLSGKQSKHNPAGSQAMNFCPCCGFELRRVRHV